MGKMYNTKGYGDNREIRGFCPTAKIYNKMTWI